MIAGDAARFLNASVHYEGTNFAMASGEAAAKTVLEARKKGDFSEKTLSLYQSLLNKSFVMKDLKRYQKMNRFAEENPEFFDTYFNALTQAAVDYFAINELSKRQQEWALLKAFNNNLRDAQKGRFSRMLPLARFFWQGLKGGMAFR